MRTSLLVLACVLIGCSKASAPSAEKVQSVVSRQMDVGFVHYDASGAQLHLKIDRLEAGDSLALQYLSRSGEIQCCRVLSGEVAEAEGQIEGQVSDEETASPLFRYRIQQSGLSDAPFVGVATVNAGNVKQPTGSSGSQLTAVTSSGPLQVDICQSSEGVHLFARQQQKRIAHLYYGFGHEVEPNCPDELFAAPEAASDAI